MMWNLKALTPSVRRLLLAFTPLACRHGRPVFAAVTLLALHDAVTDEAVVEKTTKELKKLMQDMKATKGKDAITFKGKMNTKQVAEVLQHEQVRLVW